MKNLIHVLVLAAVMLATLSCKDDGPQMGCATGILKTGDPTVRIAYQCCTKKEFLGGSNPQAGGSAIWNYYTDHEWNAVDKCSECQ